MEACHDCHVLDDAIIMNVIIIIITILSARGDPLWLTGRQNPATSSSPSIFSTGHNVLASGGLEMEVSCDDPPAPQ